MAFLVIIVVMFVVMYFLAIRPQQRKQRATQEMLSKVSPGDEIVTIGGLYGDVVEVLDDRVVLEIAEDVHVELARRAIAQIIPADVSEPEATSGFTVAAEATGDGEPIRVPEPAREEKRFGVFGRRSG